MVAVGLALAMVLTACGSAQASVNGDVRSGSGAGVNPAKLPESSTAFRIGTTAWSPTFSNNPYSPSGTLQFYNLALLGLVYYADHARPGSDPYYPELATSWKLTKSAIIVHLRKSAKWQNGKPFTSADVVTSLLLAGADSNEIWAYITSVTAPNTHEVKLSLQPWAVAQNVFTDLIQVNILPASQYSYLVPPGLQHNLVTYWHDYNVLHPTPATLKAAGSSSADKAMSAVATKLLKFNPPTFLGDGPYKLIRQTTGGTLYEKWMGWWDAKSITVPWVNVLPMSAATQYGTNIAGDIEFQEDEQFTDPQVTKLEHTRYGHYVYIPSPVQQESLVFHFADYPFNLLAVRKAFAYLINRPKLVRLDEGGTLAQDPPAKHPDGINRQEAKLYLSAKQLDSLHAYAYSPARAAKLLESVGFKKNRGVWYTPKGKPFKFSIYEQGGYSQLDEDGIIIANMLKKFGIQVSTTDTSGATYYSQEVAGKYPVSENFMDWGFGSPIADFAATFGGSQWNYPISYNGVGPCGSACSAGIGIGIGPVANVPGLGRVNIAATLNTELQTAPPSDWAKYTWDWARWINGELPILPLYNNAFHESYSTSRYMSFPPNSASWLWTGMGGAAQPVMWQQMGYLKLKST